MRARVWLFDLDNTLHDAGHAAFAPLNDAMTQYVADHLHLDRDEASRLRQHYWQRYGATMLGLIRHHGIRPAHFLAETHRLPGLEERLRVSAHDVAALRRLPGRKLVLTNAPLDYTRRVLSTLGMAGLFERIVSIESMRMFGRFRPKPDARMLRYVAARIGVDASRCVLVEDTLAHQRAARRVGMRTVWMQRYLRRAERRPERSAAQGAELSARLHRRPAYVCAKINSLHKLLEL